MFYKTGQVVFINVWFYLKAIVYLSSFVLVCSKGFTLFEYACFANPKKPGYMGENVELCNSIGGYLARFDNVREYYRLSRYVQSKLICLCRVLDGIRKYILVSTRVCILDLLHAAHI